MNIKDTEIPILINQSTMLNKSLFLHCSIFINIQAVNKGKNEFTITEKNIIISKDNQNKETYKDESFSILDKTDQLHNFIKIAEKLHKEENLLVEQHLL